jgi:hypothetical protein
MDRSVKKERIAHQSTQIEDKHAVNVEPLDVFGEIELKLLDKGASQNMAIEAVNLLREKDYSGAIDCFRRIGLSFPVKYKYQKWIESDRMARFGNKIVRYLRENLC